MLMPGTMKSHQGSVMVAKESMKWLLSSDSCQLLRDVHYLTAFEFLYTKSSEYCTQSLREGSVKWRATPFNFIAQKVAGLQRANGV